jgi:hypothetical protein
MILLLGLFPIYESLRIRDDLKVRGTVLASITGGDPIRPGFEVNLYTFSYGPVCAPCAARTHTIKSETGFLTEELIVQGVSISSKRQIIGTGQSNHPRRDRSAAAAH